jgi:hypothetical protein
MRSVGRRGLLVSLIGVVAIAWAAGCSTEEATVPAARLPERSGDAGRGADDASSSADEDGAPPAAPDATAADAPPPRCAHTFEDVALTDANYPYIRALYVREITDGCREAPRLFCPADPLTRKNAAVVLARAMGEKPSTAATDAYFDDLEADFTAPYANRLFELGVVNGCAARMFCPATPIQRDQMASLVIRATKQQPSTAAADAYFDDLGGSVHTGAINRLHELGVTQGCGARTYCPSTHLSRSQMAIFVARAFAIDAAICGR